MAWATRSRAFQDSTPYGGLVCVLYATDISNANSAIPSPSRALSISASYAEFGTGGGSRVGGPTNGLGALL